MRTLAALVFVLAAGAAPAQAPLRLGGLMPAGGRGSLSESWGALRFTLANPGPTPREGRVLVFYPQRPDVQYGRDVWVPANAEVTAWVPVGPAPEAEFQLGREINYILAVRDGDGWRTLPPTGDDRLRNRRVLYRKREPTTAVVLDEPTGDDARYPPGSLPDEAVTLARTFREARGLSEFLTLLTDPFLVPSEHGFDGVDHVVVAGNRLAADPVGRRVLRHWVQQGGTLWVMLDQTDEATVAPVLGDDCGFHVVGRTSLTTVRVRHPGDDPAKVAPREFDKPVNFVRVALSGGESVHAEVDGWPAAFSRPVGRGQVVVTTLGGRAWHRPRVVAPSRPALGDPKSPYQWFPDLPVALPPLQRLAVDVYPEQEHAAFKPEDLAPLVTADIGYAVVGQGTAALILGGFVLALLGLGLAVRRSRRPEVVGWLGPAAAFAAAGLFVVLGVGSRQAVPPTAGSAALIDVAPGAGEGAAVGVFAVYRPESGPARLAAENGGLVEIDPSGLEGTPRKRVQTDLGAWHWEDISLPAGVRVGPFRATVPTGDLAATARFTAEGVAGKLTPGPFRDVSDALLLTPAREPIPVRLAPDGAFTATEELPPDKFVVGSVLTDRQQRRQDVYRKLLAKPVPRHLDGRTMLLAWADPTGQPFAADEGARSVGTVLLVVPLEFERPAGRVTLPRGFLPYTTVVDGRRGRLTPEAAHPTTIRLRFQLPSAVLPMTVEKATFVARVRAPSRRVTVGGFADNRSVVLHEVESPLDAIRVEVTDPQLLRPDADGGLHVSLAIGSNPTTPDDLWRIESLGLEVTGRVGER